jgi:hypothetical protein
MPPNSQIVVDTSPIEAESSAPRQPTIDASIYCITIDDNCASTAGKLSKNVSLNCCPKVNSCPVLIKAKRASLFDFIRGNDFPKSSVQQFVCKIRNNYVAMQIVNPLNPFIPSKKQQSSTPPPHTRNLIFNHHQDKRVQHQPMPPQRQCAKGHI